MVEADLDRERQNGEQKRDAEAEVTGLCDEAPGGLAERRRDDLADPEDIATPAISLLVGLDVPTVGPRWRDAVRSEPGVDP